MLLPSTYSFYGGIFYSVVWLFDSINKFFVEKLIYFFLVNLARDDLLIEDEESLLNFT
jgi:hypothetical protein